MEYIGVSATRGELIQDCPVSLVDAARAHPLVDRVHDRLDVQSWSRVVLDFLKTVLNQNKRAKKGRQYWYLILAAFF